MSNRFVAGWVGALAVGMGLAGCQTAPRTSSISSNTNATKSTMAQAPQGFDKNQAAVQPTQFTAAGAGNAAAPNAAPPRLDPNAFPRTPDAMPRQMSNQTGSYTTQPGASGETGNFNFQRPNAGLTPTGLTLPASAGPQTALPTGPTQSTPIAPDRSEFGPPPVPANRAAEAALPAPPPIPASMDSVPTIPGPPVPASPASSDPFPLPGTR